MRLRSNFGCQVKGKTWLSKKNLLLESVAYTVEPAVADEWSKREEEEKRKTKVDAQDFMRDAGKNSNPVNKVTTRWRVLPAWREKLTDAMLADPASKIGMRVCPPARFPKDSKGEAESGRTDVIRMSTFSGDSAWTRSFYRFVDTAEGPVGEEIRSIEESLFHTVS